MGLNSQVSHTILQEAVSLIGKGIEFQDKSMSADLLEEYSCRFCEVPFDKYKSYLGTAMWFYRASDTPFPALQILWPDRNGIFPDGAEYDESLQGLQSLTL